MEAATYRLILLAPPALERDGETMRLSKRARDLIYYLSFQPGRPASRNALAELLWSGRFPAHAKASLRQCLSEIRLLNRTAPLIVIEGKSISVLDGAATSDLADIEACRGEALAAAMAALPSTLPLSGLDVPTALERWLLGTRAIIERRFRNHVLSVLEEARDQGDWSLLRKIGELWLARTPRDDDVIALVMRADVELRAPDAAVERYDRLISQTAQRQPVEELIAPPLLLVARFEGGIDGKPYLNMVLREELLAALSRFRDIKLVSETRSLEALNEQDGKDGYVLGATLYGRSIIVTLLERSSRTVLLCESFQITTAEIQESIDMVVRRTAGTISPRLDADAALRPHAAGPLYGRYLQARGLSASPADHGTARKAAEELEALIVQSPHFVPPLLALARLYNTDFAYSRAGTSGFAERERAHFLTKRSLDIDPRNVHGYSVMGWCQLWRGEWSRAKSAFDRALDLNPYHVERIIEVAFGHLFLGDLDRSNSLFERCLEISGNPGPVFHSDRGLLFFLTGDFGRAIEEFELVSDQSWALIYKTAALALAGRSSGQNRANAEAWLRSIWPEHQLPDRDGICSWVARQRPFRIKAHRDLLLEGIRLGFA